MDPLLEAGRHLLEGIEVMLALVTAVTLGLGLATTHRAAQDAASGTPAATAELPETARGS